MQNQLDNSNIVASYIADTVRESMLILDAEHRVLHANRTFYATFHVDREQTEGQLVYDLGNRQWDIPSLRRLLEDILPNNNPFDDFPVTHDFPNIGNRTMLLNARALSTDTVEHEMVLLAIEDVTERHRDRLKIHEHATQLEHLVQGAKDYAIFLVNPDGTVATWNDGAQRIKGYSADEIIGHHLRQLYVDEDRERGWAEHNLSRAKRDGVYREEHVRRRKDGSRFIADVTIRAIYDEDGTFYGFSKVVGDISHRKQIEEERTDLLRQLAANALRQRTLVREILRSVTDGKFNVLDDDKQMPALLNRWNDPVPATRESLGDIRRAVEQAARANQFPEERIQDLVTAVNEAVMNAVVHAGGGEVTIYTDHGGKLQVCVEDTGKGIAEEILHLATLDRGFTTAGTLGHGFFLILRLIDQMWLLTNQEGTAVLLEQYRDPPADSWLRLRGIAMQDSE